MMYVPMGEGKGYVYSADNDKLETNQIPLDWLPAF